MCSRLITCWDKEWCERQDGDDDVHLQEKLPCSLSSRRGRSDLGDLFGSEVGARTGAGT